MKIGAHVSMADGLLGAAMEAYVYKADTFMIYTGAPQNTRRTPLEKLKIREGQAFMAEHNISDIVVHAPYIINLASHKEETFKLAKDCLRTEISRSKGLGSDYLILHPGSFTEKDIDFGIRRIAEGLNEVLTNDDGMTVLLETMAGKGSEVGRSFEELKAIIDLTEVKLGICLDTCHIHDAGYDIINDFESVIKKFDALIGLENLKVLHINGSLNECGARKDRHANITAPGTKGIDHIGFEALYRIVHSEYLKDKIFILETPWLDEHTNRYKEEIAALRGSI